MTDKCKLLCEGIKDEQEAQKYYQNLIKLFPVTIDHYLIREALFDEVKHEKSLNILKNRLSDCVCNEKVKILPSHEVSNLSKEERLKIAKGIWNI